MHNLFDELHLFDEFDFNKNENYCISSTDESYRFYFTIEAFEKGNDSIFFVCQNEYEAKKYYQHFLKYKSEDEVLFYPKEPLYFTFSDSYSGEVINERIRILYALRTGRKVIIVTSVWALCEQRVFTDISPLVIDEKSVISIPELTKILIDYGYQREDVTTNRGQFSVRGGIVDVFDAIHAHPVRIEFWDDEVDSIRFYDENTQLSIENAKGVNIFPYCDMMADEQVIFKGIAKMEREAERTVSKIEDNQLKTDFQANAKEFILKLRENPKDALKFVYMYTDLEKKSILDLFENARIILNESRDMKKSYELGDKSVLRDFMLLNESGMAFKSQRRIFLSFKQLKDRFSAHTHYGLSSLDSFLALPYDRKVHAGVSDVLNYKGNINIFVKQLTKYIEDEYTVLIAYADAKQKESLLNLLSMYEFKTSPIIAPACITLIELKYLDASEFSREKVVFLKYSSVLSEPGKEQKKKKRKKSEREMFFSDIEKGDYVVHETHGIGRYEGIEKISLSGVSRDYMKIVYAREDVLYVPTEQMDLIQKYIGSQDAKPRLNRLGGAEWTNTKAKVGRCVKELAEEYIQMYAKRREIKGYAFSEDTAWQKEFEEKFEFEPTEDQIRSSEEIKQDMQKSSPMDRLLCGDVGYGKTEVAMRAAFKAVMDGKQVAVLVPTTILALQHYNNFISRFADYPIQIEMMSRFRTAKQIKKSCDDVKNGLCDILIGTHRILSSDVRFKDLGLLIIDEEQRFGVSHKDKLKLLKNNVDTLTLSATPIPRTLHMSLSGIRDMSVIETPPKNRLPVQTYVMEMDPIVIKEAISNELARGGQVFYIYNRVNDIEARAQSISKLVPGARVMYGHGQMKETELEKIILRFLNREFDVLVCTTIVENGVDIENANTLIVEDSDRFGLSQLYQLRGRVGRGENMAYSYMMYRKDKVLSSEASKRLKSIKEFTKFGSGFKIAMRDLQIRGAGNLLGANQHGHFQNVGYEMYCRMLEDAVKTELGEKAKEPEPTETEIDLNIDAYIPDTYMPSEALRIQAYKTIATLKTKEETEAYLEELIDRYADPPKCVGNLLSIALIKAKAEKCGIKKIRRIQNSLILNFHKDVIPDMEKIIDISRKYNLHVKNHEESPTIAFEIDTKSPILSYTDELLSNML